VEIPQALPQVKPRNWNGKPGFQRKALEMRLKQEDKNFYTFILDSACKVFFFFTGRVILQEVRVAGNPGWRAVGTRRTS
jgi:hypothetical protein